MGLEHIQPSQDRAFVVRRSTANQSSSFVVHDEGKRLRVPAIALVSLLQSTRLAACRTIAERVHQYGNSQAARRSGRR